MDINPFGHISLFVTRSIFMKFNLWSNALFNSESKIKKFKM